MKLLLAFFLLSAGVLQAQSEEVPLICYVAKSNGECYGSYRVYSRVEDIRSFPFTKPVSSDSPEEQFCISTYGSQWVEENANLPSQDLAAENAIMTASNLKLDGYCRSVVIKN